MLKTNLLEFFEKYQKHLESLLEKSSKLAPNEFMLAKDELDKLKALKEATQRRIEYDMDQRG